MSQVPYYQMFIDGQWADGESCVEVIAPATENVSAIVAFGGIADADRAVAAAKRAYNSGVWRNTSPQQRADVLECIAELLTQRTDQLVAIVTAENGATFKQANAFHIGLAIASLRHSAATARTYNWVVQQEPVTVPTHAQGILVREPIGVVAGIVPFNFPLVLAIWKLGPALAAGNTVVIKTDERTPLTILEFARAAEEAGLPAGVLNVITGLGEEVGAHLAAHPDVRKVAFTGSIAAGREVMRAAASNIKKVTLELGGKGPNILLPDANLDIAIPGALFAFLFYSGQVCESGTRLLVPREQHDDIVLRLAAKASTIVVGDPTDPETDIGPVISGEAVQRINGYVEGALRDGAKVAFRTQLPQTETFDKGHWVAPTILTDVTNDMTIAQEEIFGPVLVVIAYDSVEDAIKIANDSDFGLSAGVWGTDVGNAVSVANQIEAGTVWVNDFHMFPLNGPFGGYKQSGIGRELGDNAFDEYTEVKFVHVALNQDPTQRAYSLVLGHDI